MLPGAAHLLLALLSCRLAPARQLHPSHFLIVCCPWPLCLASWQSTRWHKSRSQTNKACCGMLSICIPEAAPNRLRNHKTKCCQYTASLLCKRLSCRLNLDPLLSVGSSARSILQAACHNVCRLIGVYQMTYWQESSLCWSLTSFRNSKTHFLNAVIPKTESAWHITSFGWSASVSTESSRSTFGFQPVCSYGRAFPTRHFPAWSGGYKIATPLCKPFWQSATVQVYKVLLLHYWPRSPPPRA